MTGPEPWGGGLPGEMRTTSKKHVEKVRSEPELREIFAHTWLLPISPRWGEARYGVVCPWRPIVMGMIVTLLSCRSLTTNPLLSADPGPLPPLVTSPAADPFSSSLLTVVASPAACRSA